MAADAADGGLRPSGPFPGPLLRLTRTDRPAFCMRSWFSIADSPSRDMKGLPFARERDAVTVRSSARGSFFRIGFLRTGQPRYSLFLSVSPLFLDDSPCVFWFRSPRLLPASWRQWTDFAGKFLTSPRDGSVLLWSSGPSATTVFSQKQIRRRGEARFARPPPERLSSLLSRFTRWTSVAESSRDANSQCTRDACVPYISAWIPRPTILRPCAFEFSLRNPPWEKERRPEAARNTLTSAAARPRRKLPSSPGPSCTLFHSVHERAGSFGAKRAPYLTG